VADVGTPPPPPTPGRRAATRWIAAGEYRRAIATKARRHEDL